MLVYACSSNPGKLREFRLIATELCSTEIDILLLPGLKDIAPPEETGTTFEQNARQKALYYSQFTTEIVLADDSGIEVDALNGAPGVYSARYAGPDATSQANNTLLLTNMQNKGNRKARFVCVIALARQGRILQVNRGTVEGELLSTPQGLKGFGYDPLFFYPPFGASFGDLDDSLKFEVSHRGSALRQVVAWLLTLSRSTA